MTSTATNHYPKSRSELVRSEQFYKEVMESSASYNSRLCTERKLRLPFLDSQTRVAQNHGNLLMPYRYRGPGHRPDQLYSYPARRWKKKKRSMPLPEVPLSVSTDKEPADAGVSSMDMHQISAVENPAVKSDPEMMPDTTMPEATPYKEYYDDWENISEPPDAGEIDDRNSDSSDFEETYIKKKKRKAKGKGTGGGRGRKKQQTPEEKEMEDKEKPYSCDICGARYKTRPGLSYHLTHSHKTEEREEEPPPAPSPELAMPTATATTTTTPTTAEERSKVSRYCDFCLGDEVENKKTGQKEELVSCADCGRSGHPSCLQFTPNMIISVKKYPWQCIECKSCGLCGTSDNDDQLLFCDDCDRGYHMYCLNPPLSEPPEGSWSCHLCIQEFYGGRKPHNIE